VPSIANGGGRGGAHRGIEVFLALGTGLVSPVRSGGMSAGKGGDGARRWQACVPQWRGGSYPGDMIGGGGGGV
jgi:predicted phage gp36 major capsid-like protein